MKYQSPFRRPCPELYETAQNAKAQRNEGNYFSPPNIGTGLEKVVPHTSVSRVDRTFPFRCKTRFLRALSILANGFSFVNSPPKPTSKHQFYRQNPYGITRNSQRSYRPLKQCFGADADGTISHPSAVFDELRTCRRIIATGNLPRIVFVSPTTMVATIPLKPPTDHPDESVFLPPDQSG